MIGEERLEVGQRGSETITTLCPDLRSKVDD